MTWTTRSSRTVYENRWIEVREDEVTGPDGDGIYGVVRMQQPAVFIIALDENERGKAPHGLPDGFEPRDDVDAESSEAGAA